MPHKHSAANHVDGVRLVHASVLQSCWPVKSPHSVPPFDAGTVTVRERVCVPPPQAAEHVDHAVHSEVSQSTLESAHIPHG